MSRDARGLIQRLLDVDSRRRYRACDLMREPWIKCNDLPLSIFETAGSLFRANSVDARASMSNSSFVNPTSWTRSNSKADCFNRNIANIHVQALGELKKQGYSSKAIDESLKSGNGNVQTGTIGGGINHQNQIYKAY